MLGLGVDIVEVARFRRSLERGEAFSTEVFSQRERAYCDAQARPPQHYAARFAAKEAFLKALGRGILGGVALPEIEVVREGESRPSFRLGPAAAAALSAVGATTAHVSLSHDAGMAIAVVVVA